jgi:hypothetical protein
VAGFLVPANQVLLLGHGLVKANASDTFEVYLEKHRRQIANKIVVNVRCGIHDLSNVDLLRIGELSFETNVSEREYPDLRWSKPRPVE